MKTNEDVTRNEIWKVFNHSKEDGEYLLSFSEEEEIDNILKRYAKLANEDVSAKKYGIFQNIVSRVFPWIWIWFALILYILLVIIANPIQYLFKGKSTIAKRFHKWVDGNL